MSKVDLPHPDLFDCVKLGGEPVSHGYSTAQMEAYAAAKVREALDWRPIETAPKDGTAIDVYRRASEGRFADVFWGKPHHCCGEMGRYCDSEWHDLEDGWVDGVFNEPLDSESITHWMPIPPAP